jgi:tetratricopeptide (TPR) repeat protein
MRSSTGASVSGRTAASAAQVQMPAIARGARAPQPDREHAATASTAAPSRRALLAAAAAAVLALNGNKPAAAAPAEPFLKRSGGRGFLAEEEAALVSLRAEKEGEALRSLEAERELIERELDSSKDGKLCATPFGVDVVGITEAIALVGALVGGVTARNRKREVERLNEQLRKINVSLRQQARAGTVYAPGLSYAPPSAGGGGGAVMAAAARNGGMATAALEVAAPGGVRTGVLVAAPPAPSAAAAAPAAAQAPVITDADIAAAASEAADAVAAIPAPEPSAVADASSPPQPGVSTIFSMDDDDMSTDQIQCRDALRAGKRLLKEQNGAAAMVRFEKALLLSRALADGVQQRRAVRGLAAAARLQGQYRAAIGHLERVLELSKQMGEFTGDADAYGVIADCYTDLGEFEKAALYYDKYIGAME